MSMSGIATWLSIGVLVLGSVAVFAWFVVDVRKWLQDHPSRRRRDD